MSGPRPHIASKWQSHHSSLVFPFSSLICWVQFSFAFLAPDTSPIAWEIPVECQMNKWMTHSELVGNKSCRKCCRSAELFTKHQSHIKYSIELNFELRELDVNLCMSKIFEWELNQDTTRVLKLTQAGDSLTMSPGNLRSGAPNFTADLQSGGCGGRSRSPSWTSASVWENGAHPVSSIEAREKERRWFFFSACPPHLVSTLLSDIPVLPPKLPINPPLVSH